MQNRVVVIGNSCWKISEPEVSEVYYGSITSSV